MTAVIISAQKYMQIKNGSIVQSSYGRIDSLGSGSGNRTPER